MYNILAAFKLKQNISIPKLGLEFRSLTKEEKTKIVMDIDRLYLKNKDSINKFIEENISCSEPEFLLNLFNIEKDLQNFYMLMVHLKKKGYVVNSKKRMLETIDRMIIIECDLNILKDLIDEKKSITFISNILSLYNIYVEPTELKFKARKDYSFILEDNIFDTSDPEYLFNLTLAIMVSFDKVSKIMYKQVELSEDYLNKLAFFISKLDVDEMRRFVMIIDFIFSRADSMQSRILNLSIIIESILIKENQDIRQNFVLKTGIIMKKSLTKGNNLAIQELLKYSYDIRSCIVHGNEDKAVELLNTLNNKTKYLKDFDVSSSHKSKKNESFVLAETVLLIHANAVIKYWIDDFSMIRYMKNN